MDEMQSRELARSLRIAVAADGVLRGIEDGDRAGEQLARMMSAALLRAEGGMLSASDIAGLSRFSRGRPRVAGWIAILRSILDAQDANAAHERASTWRGSYAIDPRRWTTAERDAWLRAHPGSTWAWLVERWDAIVGSASTVTR